MRFAEGQAVVQPQRYAESMRNTHSPRGKKSEDSYWTVSGDESSKIERRLCALRKVRLWSNRSVMQSLCGIPTIYDRKNPRIPRGLLVDVPKGTSIRGLREDFDLCGRSGRGPTVALSRDYAGYPRPTRRKIRRFYVDVYVDESSKIESRLCALRTVKLWTKETAGCNQLPMVLLVPIGNAGSMVVPKLQFG